MAFFGRVMNYLLNEVLVNSLANSKTFQKFAIRSNAMFSDTAKKAVEQQKDIHLQGKEFFKVFRDEMRKGFDDISQKR